MDMHMNLHMRAKERAAIAREMREKRFAVPEKVRQARAAMLAEHDAKRAENARQEAIERQAPTGELAHILVTALDADELARALDLLARVNLVSLREAVTRLTAI